MATVRKFVTAAVAAIAMAISLGLLPEDVNKYVAVAVAFLGAVGVYIVPNKVDESPRPSYIVDSKSMGTANPSDVSVSMRPPSPPIDPGESTAAVAMKAMHADKPAKKASAKKTAPVKKAAKRR